MWKCVHFIYMSCVFMKLHRRATRIQHMLSVPYASSQSHSDPAHVVSAIHFIAEPLGSSTCCQCHTLLSVDVKNYALLWQFRTTYRTVGQHTTRIVFYIQLLPACPCIETEQVLWSFMGEFVSLGVMMMMLIIIIIIRAVKNQHIH